MPIRFNLVSLFLLSRVLVQACLNSQGPFGDNLSGSTAFSDEASLNSNYRNGMTVEQITVCSNDFGGTTYHIGI